MIKDNEVEKRVTWKDSPLLTFELVRNRFSFPQNRERETSRSIWIGNGQMNYVFFLFIPIICTYIYHLFILPTVIVVFSAFPLIILKLLLNILKLIMLFLKNKTLFFFFNKKKIFLQVVIFKSILNGINNFIELFFLKV